MDEERGLLEQRLKTHVQQLAGTIGERNPLRYDNLEAARRYIERVLSEIGYAPEYQAYHVDAREYRNIIVEKKGAERQKYIFVVGAHYDTAWGTPGADDNASGVACLLELARPLFSATTPLNLRFVCFTLEEPPFFQTRHMGSRVYARQLKQEKAPVAGMLSLEMVGYYREERGSQQFPLPLMNLFYPSQGNFVAIAGNFESRQLVRRLAASLKAQCDLPVEQVALPMVPGVSLSDNWAFWQEGYQAVMITDTAFFRNPHYHRHSDLPHTLDYRRVALLTSGLAKVLAAF